MRTEWCMDINHRKSARLGNIFECDCKKFTTEEVIDWQYVEPIRERKFFDYVFNLIKK